MNITLVFDRWTRNGKSIQFTPEGVELSMGLFHSGTAFYATIDLDEDDEQELRDAMLKGYQPAFWVSP